MDSFKLFLETYKPLFSDDNTKTIKISVQLNAEKYFKKCTEKI